MKEIQTPSCNYRNLVGAASELKDAYHNYQKQIKSKYVLNWRPVILVKYKS